MSELVQQIRDHQKRRRATDHVPEDVAESFGSCPAFSDHASIPRVLEILEKIAERQEEQSKKLEQVAEIIDAWNTTKGFVSGIKIFSAAIKILTPIVLLIGGGYVIFKGGK